MVEDYKPISEDVIRLEAEPFKFSKEERDSLHSIKESLAKGGCSYEDLSDFREYLDRLIEKVHTTYLNQQKLSYDTNDIVLDLQFLHKLQGDVVNEQHNAL